MHARKEKGPCFVCDEKFSPGHRCKELQLLLLEVGEEDENGGEMEGKNELLEISIHALLGMASPQTMQMDGLIKHQLVLILIDGGNTKKLH